MGIAAVGIALLMTPLKGCVCSSLLPPKDVLKRCKWSLNVISLVRVLLRTWPKRFAGTGESKQRVTLTLPTSYWSWARGILGAGIVDGSGLKGTLSPLPIAGIGAPRLRDTGF
jgi:hypothetical protein